MKSFIVCCSSVSLKDFKTSTVHTNMSIGTKSRRKSTLSFLRLTFYVFRTNCLPFSSTCKIYDVEEFRIIRSEDCPRRITVVSTTFLSSFFLSKCVFITLERSTFVMASA